jgi:hypothetical protein
MKRGHIILAIVIILLLIIIWGVLLFNLGERESIVDNGESIINDTDIIAESSLITSSKNCGEMSYPGAGAIGRNSGLDCYKVYNAAFYSNQSYHCEYLSLNKNKAICFGTSITSWKDKSICDQFEGEDNEICILNVLNKLDNLNLLSTVGDSLSCLNFQNQDFYKVCNNYKNVILRDFSSCFIEGGVDDYCIHGFITINQDKDLIKSLCDDAFDEPVKKFKCFFESKAINHTWLNESLDLGIVKEENIEKNASFLFSEVLIETEYPVLLRYVKTYWKENPDYIKGSVGLISSEFILDTEIEDYICKKKITSVSDMDNFCISYDWSDLLDSTYFPKSNWNYYKLY